MKKLEGRPVNAEEIKSVATPLKKSIENKIDEEKLSGVMMQEIAEGLINGKIQDKAGAKQLLHETFVHDPFDGNELTPEQKESAINEAMDMMDKRLSLKELEKQINTKLNGIFNVIDIRQSRELFYGTKGNEYLDRANQLSTEIERASRSEKTDNEFDATVEKYENILKEAEEIFQTATQDMNKKELNKVRKKLGLPSEEK